MTIYFLRHASAGESKKDPVKDAKRGLDHLGLEQATRMGRLLASVEPHLDAIFTSPLKRASQTAALVANEMGFEGKLAIESALRPEAAFSSFQQLLEKSSGHAAILVVGHNPNLAQFLGKLIAGSGAAAHLELRKAGLAKVETSRNGATLQWLISPKLAKQ